MSTPYHTRSQAKKIIPLLLVFALLLQTHTVPLEQNEKQFNPQEIYLKKDISNTMNSQISSFLPESASNSLDFDNTVEEGIFHVNTTDSMLLFSLDFTRNRVYSFYIESMVPFSPDMSLIFQLQAPSGRNHYLLRYQGTINQNRTRLYFHHASAENGTYLIDLIFSVQVDTNILFQVKDLGTIEQYYQALTARLVANDSNWVSSVDYYSTLSPSKEFSLPLLRDTEYEMVFFQASCDFYGNFNEIPDSVSVTLELGTGEYQLLDDVFLPQYGLISNLLEHYDPLYHERANEFEEENLLDVLWEYPDVESLQSFYSSITQWMSSNSVDNSPLLTPRTTKVRFGADQDGMANLSIDIDCDALGGENLALLWYPVNSYTAGDVIDSNNASDPTNQTDGTENIYDTDPSDENFWSFFQDLQDLFNSEDRIWEYFQVLWIKNRHLVFLVYK